MDPESSRQAMIKLAQILQRDTSLKIEQILPPMPPIIVAPPTPSLPTPPSTDVLVPTMPEEQLLDYLTSTIFRNTSCINYFRGCSTIKSYLRECTKKEKISNANTID